MAYRVEAIDAGPALAARSAAPPLATRLRRDAEGIHAIWVRELLVFRREKSRVISSLVQPLLWIFVFGGGVGSTVSVPGGNYRAFIFPGIVIMSTMFSCVFYGMYIVWDKKLDVLKQVLVSPISRVAIFTGKVLGGCTDALIQAVLLLLLGLIITPMHPAGMLAGLGLLTVAAIGLTGLGLAIGSFFESPEGFQVIFSFLVFPMFLMSGAVYPLTNLPLWLHVATRANPLTYAVDGLRGVLLGTHTFALGLDVAVMVAFSTAMVWIGSWAFSRTR